MKIGKTPFQKIKLPKFKDTEVYAKLEGYNNSGSVKDRMAHYMTQEAIKDGKVNEGTTIIEATTGNTGIAFSALAVSMNMKMIAIMPEGQSIERIKLMQAYGAQVVLTPKDLGPKEAIRHRDKLGKRISNSWIPDQFNNELNIEAHEMGLGLELLHEIKDRKIVPDYIVHGVGTGGTLMGLSNVLKPIYPDLRIVAVEPEESPALKTGNKFTANHGIQGIGEGFIPSIMDRTLIDKVITVKTSQALDEMRLLVRRQGISAGVSSGANIAAIKRLLSETDLTNLTIITIFADGIDRYLSLLSS